MRHHRWVLTAVWCFSCGGAPQVKATADHRENALDGKRVLYVPLSVSSDIGDERTGIILSDKTRATASSAACHETAEAWTDGTIVCFDQRPVANRKELAEVELRFASDKPIPPELWQALREISGADHALMFRPESVSSSREVSRDTKVVADQGAVLAFGHIVALMVASHEETTTSADTEIAYTVSASLVDMHTGKLLKVGVHSGSDSRTEKRDLGYAEAPPAAPILQSIMIDLGEAVLEE